MTKTILVNKENKIKNNFLNKIQLVKTKNIHNEEIEVEKETLESFYSLCKYMKEQNIEMGIEAGLRTQTQQEEIQSKYMAKFGKDYCDIYVADPGYSEHHTGLAIDFYIKEAGEVFKNLSAYETVHKYLKDFGFILRYPAGKQDITGYAYEPWHIRYVGKFVATIIYENNVTLEEYVNNYSGLIAVNKKKGMTSFDIVKEISNLFGIKKVGHTGTLDPLAEGVLIVAIGKATKVVELVTGTYKEYIAEAKLGIRTDTRDITGNINKKCDEIDTNNLTNIVKSFQKTYLQEVPIYSAVKVNGKKLYQYARENEEVELPKKEVTVKNIELLEHKEDLLKIKTTVSKGTYIRSLIDDIGEKLGCHATMQNLIRTKQANINIEEAFTLNEIRNNNFKLLSIDYVLDYPIEIIDNELERKIRTGQQIKNTFNIVDKVIFKSKTGKLLGIYEAAGTNLKTWKNFV